MKLALLSVIVVVAGCNSTSDQASTAAPASIVAATPGGATAAAASPVVSSEVIVPRGEDLNVDPNDYVASNVPYRLFGTAKGDGVRGPSAVIADTTTWSTRTYHVGDALGRGLKVKAIGEHDVTLQSATKDVGLGAGNSASLRFIAHRLDLAITPLGRMSYRVAMTTVTQLPVALPTTDATSVYGQTVRRLGPIPADTLLSQADFQEGDFLATVNGAAVGDDGVDQLRRGLTTGTGSLSVRVYRNGVALDRTYLKQ